MTQRSERKVNISIHPEFIDHVTRPKHIRDIDYMQTIGYMSLWGNPDEVDIFVDRYGEITGLYYRRNEIDNSKVRYFTMGGIPDSTTGKYSTHS